jgi:hypothetical protein
MVNWLRITLVFSFLLNFSATAQDMLKPTQIWFNQCDLYVGEQHFSSAQHLIFHNNKHRMAFAFEAESSTVRFELHLPAHLHQLQVLPNADYELVDSVRLVADSYYAFKLKFNNLFQAAQLVVLFEVQSTAGKTTTQELHLMPYATTRADFYPPQSDLFVGEVQRFEIQSNHTANLVLDGLWQEGSVFNYRLAREDDKAFIFLEPKVVGAQVFEVQLITQKPYLDTAFQPVYELPVIAKHFNIRSSRFPFLRFVEREIIRDPNRITTAEVQIDNHRLLRLNTLYRIEAAEAALSPVVAELRPLRRLSNDKVLCELRPYHNHEQGDGFLYIKEGEQLLFLTNIDIVPQPTLKKVMVMSNGNDWTTNLSVRPGEQLMLRIEGSFLRNAHFSFGELEYKRMDSLELEDKVQLYQMKVPLGIEQRKVVALLNNEPTSIEFVIREHQSPRRIDFITVNYSEGPINAADITQPILFPRAVNDVIFQFDRAKIDEAVALYGKQHIRIVVRLEDKNNNLIESAVLGPFWGCPDESSVRYAYYGKSDCRRDEIKLNDFLSRKTNVLNEWGRIQITIEHIPTSYGTEGFSKRIVIYNRRRTTFDVDVSIPAGLFVQKLGPDQPLASLSGISFAMIAQFSFYKKNEIQKPIPFKIGAGFLAQNAFNFNPEAERDLGIIVLASVYPIKGNNRISFPLYGGFGYFLQEDKFFAVIGPGIRVSF